MNTQHGIIMGIILAIVVGLLLWISYQLIVNEQSSNKSWDRYADRKQKFFNSISLRQKAYLEKIKGASQTEIVTTLEQRIYDLEQRLAQYERHTLDDGK